MILHDIGVVYGGQSWPICAPMILLLWFCSYDFDKTRATWPLFEPHVRSTWAILEHHSSYASYKHCWCFYMTLEWYKEGKAPNMCPYYFAPMILLLSFWQNKGYWPLFEPHVRSTWASLGPYLSAIAAMHPTIIADNSTWHWNGIRRVKFPNMCSYDFAPMILLLWFLTKTKTKPLWFMIL